MQNRHQIPTVGLRISGHRAPGISTDFAEEHKLLRFTKANQRHANIRENKGPSLAQMKVRVPHQRSPYALKFEGRSQEETEKQERAARGDAWRLAKKIEAQRKGQSNFFLTC